jgi:hypothetical protein
VTTTPTAPGLADLDRVVLAHETQAQLDGVAAMAGGDPAWRARKRVEAHQLLALAQIAGPERLAVHMLDLEDDFRAVIRLNAPVAMEPDGDGDLRVADGAILGINYARVALAQPMPGFAFVRLLVPPAGAWYPNIGGAGQLVCLGASLPAGIPVTELVLGTWGVLTMQAVMLDPDDHAGVMNGQAAAWWSARADRMPLAAEPFLRQAPAGEEAGSC